MKSVANRRAVAAAAVSAAVLVPLGVFGAPALARSAAAASQYQYSGSSQYQYKVAICHRTHSRKHPFHEINVGARAAKAHLRHGDTLAPCPPAAPGRTRGHGHGHDDHKSGDTTTTTTTTPTHTENHGDDNGRSGDHGKSGDHGNSGDHGHGHGK